MYMNNKYINTCIFLFIFKNRFKFSSFSYFFIIIYIKNSFLGLYVFKNFFKSNLNCYIIINKKEIIVKIFYRNFITIRIIIKYSQTKLLFMRFIYCAIINVCEFERFIFFFFLNYLV